MTTRAFVVIPTTQSELGRLRDAERVPTRGQNDNGQWQQEQGVPHEAQDYGVASMKSLSSLIRSKGYEGILGGQRRGGTLSGADELTNALAG
eukprot:3174801-Amphidinium_carterae.1